MRHTIILFYPAQRWSGRVGMVPLAPLLVIILFPTLFDFARAPSLSPPLKLKSMKLSTIAIFCATSCLLAAATGAAAPPPLVLELSNEYHAGSSSPPKKNANESPGGSPPPRAVLAEDASVPHALDRGIAEDDDVGGPTKYCSNATLVVNRATVAMITWDSVRSTTIFAASLGLLCLLGYELFRRDPLVGKYVYDRKRLTQPDRSPPPLMISRSLWRGGGGGCAAPRACPTQCRSWTPWLWPCCWP